jgi:hypothetical protein
MTNKAWTPEQEEELIHQYTEITKDVHRIADHFDKGYRSVISKLVQLKIYEKPEPIIDKQLTVKEMIRDLEQILGFTMDGGNLNKKENLAKLHKVVREKLADE